MDGVFGMDAEYRSLVRNVAEAVWSFFTFFKPPPYILDNGYRGKIADGMDDEIGVISEERAKAILGTKKPVLGFYSGNGDLYLTTNPLNSDRDIRKYVKWHEEGHSLYNQKIELKSIYPDEEAFCDFYAIGNFIEKYGAEKLERIAKLGVVDEKALRLYEQHVSRAQKAWWN